jgi:hypothetical protein
MEAADHDAEEAARAAVEQRDKLIATLKARAALHGYVVHIIDRGSNGQPVFLIARWGRQHEVPTVDALEDFLRRAGA